MRRIQIGKRLCVPLTEADTAQSMVHSLFRDYRNFIRKQNLVSIYDSVEISQNEITHFQSIPF